MERSCLIALGSNLGDRFAMLQAGIHGLQAAGWVVVDASGLWLTDAQGADHAQPFLNAVLELRGDMDPWALLRLCKQIEQAVGRLPGGPRNASRCLDLDILAMEGVLLRSPALSLPHPRMQGRAFVLRPLAQLTHLKRFLLDPVAESGRGELEQVAGPEWIAWDRLPGTETDRMFESQPEVQT